MTAPHRAYWSASNGGAAKCPLGTMDAGAFAGSMALQVSVADADAGFRWGLDLEGRPGPDDQWSAVATVWSGKSGSESKVVSGMPESGELRLVVRAEDAGAASRVLGYVAITVLL